MMDNGIYGMTKGQLSPTTGSDQQTKTTPYGVFDDPVNPLRLALGYGVSFIARGFSGNVKHTVDLIIQAIQHPGFAFLQILSPCVTFVGRDQFSIIRSHAVELGPDYDPTKLENAWALSNETDKISLGILYREERPTYEERLKRLHSIAKHQNGGGFNALLQKYSVAA